MRWPSRLRLPTVEVALPRRERRALSPVTSYYMVLVAAGLLAAIGLLMSFSAQAVMAISQDVNPYVAFLKPAALMVFALVAATVVQMLPVALLRRGAFAIFTAGLLLQLLILTPLGASEGGNTNWVHIPGVPFLVQPSEFLKLALIILLARCLDRPGTRLTDWRQMAVIAGAPTLVALGAVMLGHDMGTTIVLALIAAAAVWVAGAPTRWYVVLAFLAVPLLAFAVASNPTRLRRILAILPGFRPPRVLSAPEQIDHALWAFGSGGFFGLGPGASREKWNYLQAAHTDFVLAIIGEEFGLIGTLLVLATLGVLVWGMLRVCVQSAKLFPKVIAAGVATWVGVQGVVNVMSVTGIGPVIGVPLPLVSYGGSSLLFTATAVGVVLGIARENAGMRRFGRPDEASAGRDPRVLPRRRRPDTPPRASSGAGRQTERRPRVRVPGKVKE